MIIFVSLSMFDHKPQRCPFGHSLWPGMAQVGWQPCICTVAREAAERGRGMGPPHRLYGSQLDSNYQGQEIALSKHFKRERQQPREEREERDARTRQDSSPMSAEHKEPAEL